MQVLSMAYKSSVPAVKGIDILAHWLLCLGWTPITLSPVHVLIRCAMHLQIWDPSTWTRSSALVWSGPSGTATTRTSRRRLASTRRTPPWGATYPTWNTRKRSETPPSYYLPYLPFIGQHAYPQCMVTMVVCWLKVYIFVNTLLKWYVLCPILNDAAVLTG